MVVVIAKIKAKKGQGDTLAQKLSDMVEWVTENEGDTLTYICNRSTKNRDEFVFFERYPNQKALEGHSTSDRFHQLVGEIQSLLDGPIQIDLLEEVAAKL